MYKKYLASILALSVVFFGVRFDWSQKSGNVSVVGVQEARADTTATKYAGTAVDGGGTSDCTWGTPSNATGDTTSTSTSCSVGGNNKFTNYLNVTNFGFTADDVPSGATINGVVVEVEWMGGAAMNDTTVQLMTDGSTGVGNNKATNAAKTTKTLQSYGGSADGWGASLTQSAIISSNFGVKLQYKKTAGGPAQSTDVYRVRVTVYYTPGAVVAISLSTDGAVAFGTLATSTTQDTTASGVNDVQTVSVDTGPVDLVAKSTTWSDGGNTWTLGGSSGSNQVFWEFSGDGSSWTTFAAASTDYSLATSISTSSTQNMYLRLTTPSSTSSFSQYSSTVTVTASAP